jgi:dienelactone hydrolase
MAGRFAHAVHSGHTKSVVPEYRVLAIIKDVMLKRALSTLFLLPMAAALMAQQAPDSTSVARSALDLILKKQFADLQKMFAPSYRDGATPANLAKLGPQDAWGAMQSVGDPSVNDMGPVQVVTIPVKFAQGTYNFVVFVNASKQVGQLGFRAGETPWQSAAYAKAGTYTERNCMLGDEWKLPCTITVPAGKGPYPAVVLVHGTGVRDRDETAGPNKIFKDLADGLASRGIASIRYDKRIKQYAAKMADKPYTFDEDTTEDSVKAAALLRTQPEVDPAKVYVLGHEMGGYAAPRIAEADGKLAGIILLAANERPLEDLYIDQAIATNKPKVYLDGIRAAAARIKKLDPGDVDRAQELGLPIAYWLDLRSYEAGALMKTFGGPILVLQGERDFQVPMTDFTEWKRLLSGRKDVTFKSYPALNHMFIAGEGKSSEEEYKKPGHVDTAVIDDLVAFIK